MSTEPSSHQLRSLKKSVTKHEQRLELKELRKQRRIERSPLRSDSRQRYNTDPLDGEENDYEENERRRNQRPASSRQQQHFRAANIDQVVVVCSPLRPPFRPRLLDRYLVAASAEALPVVICLNKTDLGIPDEVGRYPSRYRRLASDSCRQVP